MTTKVRITWENTMSICAQCMQYYIIDEGILYCYIMSTLQERNALPERSYYSIIIIDGIVFGPTPTLVDVGTPMDASCYRWLQPLVATRDLSVIIRGHESLVHVGKVPRDTDIHRIILT